MRVQISPAELLVGLEAADDAAVWLVAPDRAIVETLDFFPPIVDDAYASGAIAAANAMSDVYAMGGEVLFALQIAAWPDDLPLAQLERVFAGAVDLVREAGGVIAGGHTVSDQEPKFGLAVTGLVHPDRMLLKGMLRPGDALWLTKPLGTGILTTAHKRGTLAAEDLASAVDVMTRLNRAAARAAVRRLHAGTDVTGFGLAGHASEMAEASRVAVHRTPAPAVSFPRARARGRGYDPRRHPAEPRALRRRRPGPPRRLRPRDGRPRPGPADLGRPAPGRPGRPHRSVGSRAGGARGGGVADRRGRGRERRDDHRRVSTAAEDVAAPRRARPSRPDSARGRAGPLVGRAVPLAWPGIVEQSIRVVGQLTVFAFVAHLGAVATAGGRLVQPAVPPLPGLERLRDRYDRAGQPADGRRSSRAAGDALRQSLVLAAALGVASGAAFAAGARPALLALGAEPAVADAGAPLALVGGLNVFQTLSIISIAATRAAGDTRTPMWLSAGSTVVMVPLAYLLIDAAGLGVLGAAISIVAVNVLFALATLLVLLRGRAPACASAAGAG